MFSQMVKAINSPTKQLMLVLSVLVFSANLYAGGNHSYTMTAKVATTCTGTGKVYVSTTEVAISSIAAKNWGDPKDASRSADKDETISNINFWVYANAEPGYYFVKWTGDVTGSVNPGAHTDKKLNANADDVSKTATADFASILEFPYGKTITLYTDLVTGEVLPATIQIKVNKSTSLTITPNNAAFSVVTNSPVSLNGTVGEYVTIQITATARTPQGDYANAIKLSPNHSTLNDTYMYEPKDEYLNVNILPSPTIIFNPPVNPVGGSYTYQQTNIVPKPNPVLVNEVKEVGLLDGNDGVIELVATPATGYRVYRWISTHGGVEEIDYLSGNKKLVNWTKDAEVTIEFTEDKYASFFVKENPSVKYNDLNLALEAAASSSSKTVVVDPTYNNTARCNGGYLRTGTYTIPDGYTLLVPGDANYTALADKTNPTDKDWATEAKLATSNFCKLIVEEGTIINVDGVLCVYAKWNYASTTANYMKPGTYGWIELEDNAVININDATLHALGYITNTKDTRIISETIDQVGKVIANNGAVVYEIFVMNDWRGGSAITGVESGGILQDMAQLAALATIAGGGKSGLVKNDAKVFPMSQYYVQCIEAPITFKHGAKEKLQTMVIIGTFKPMATFDFIVPNNTSDPDDTSIASGLLRVGNNTKVTKYYDASEDRIKFIVEEAEPEQAQTIPTFFHSLNMELAAGGQKVPVSSVDYTMPITNNMDIVVKSGSSLIIPNKCDLCFLSGASLTIEQGASIDCDANIYVYDADEKLFHDLTYKSEANGLGYFGPGNQIIAPIPYRPYTLYARTSDSINDAKFHIDGSFRLNENGNLYTTAGGANITSNGGGKIAFGNKVSKDTTAQAYQSGIAFYCKIPVTIARLYNADTTFSAGNNIEAGQQYIYYTDINGGTWSLPRAAVSSVTLPTLSVTLPTQSAPTGEIVCVVTKPEGVRDYVKTDFVIVNSKTTLFTLGEHRVEGDQLIIPITYNKQDKHSDLDITATVTIKKSNTAAVSLVEKEITVVATEKYKPDFSATTPTLSSTVGTPIFAGVNFSLVQENVTTIWNDATYGSRFEWSTSTPAITGNNASEFAFAYGRDENKLAGAMVTFTPASTYTADAPASATLTLVATYTDGAGHKESTSIDIPLSGTATLNGNTLEFALPFPDPIYEDSEAFPLFEEDSRNNTNGIQFTLTPEDVVEIIGDGTDATPYMVKPLKAGVVELSVSQNASASVKGIEDGTMKITIQVQPKQLELFPLDLCVDDQDKFSAHTLTAQLVRFENNAIIFTSNESQTSIWEMQFEGVPQYVTFSLSGTNNWLVQQGDKDGQDWKTLPINATGTFDGSLLPTTRRLKFTYAMGNSEGSLTNLCINDLDLSATTDKAYLPINADGSPSSVEFEFVHTKNLTFNALEELSISTNTVNAGTAEEPYLTTTVTISPNAKTELDKSYTLTATDGETTKEVVVRTYRFPQFLPINLETDPVERFYFINLAGEGNTKHVGWNEDSREIIYQNPGGQEARYATFAFEGAPHHVSFDVDGDVNVSDWVVFERSEGTDFVAVASAPVVNGKTITYELDYSSKYVRIDNVSTNMSEVKLSNLIIEGKPEIFVAPEELLLNKSLTELPITITAVNLDSVRFELSDPINFAFKQSGDDTELTTLLLNKDNYNGLGYNKYCDISLDVIWKAQNAIDDGLLTIYDDKADTIMCSVRLLGTERFVTIETAENSGLYTGIPQEYTYNNTTYTDYNYRQVNLINTFATDGTALFDYLFIYGPTTTVDSEYNITLPGDDGELIGSNAKTPYYVYKRVSNAEGRYIGYQYIAMVENANTAEKSTVEGIIVKDSSTVYIDVQDSLRVYITGFAPYATTGFTKEDEGVWFFRGSHGEKLDIYLEDCHIFSRNKTLNGNAFYGNKEGGELFDEAFARGSGGVLVFENTDSQEQLQNYTPFEVNIHTIGDNLLKSNYGCFYILLSSMKAYQISAPIHIRMASVRHVRTTKTTLNIDDKWPTAVNANNAIIDIKRTNGYLGLKKQSNNAPSIDLGNPNTIVNFNGGRVELQNAQIVSENYKTTLAISYRSGEYGSDGLGIKLSYGIGTDSVGGTVNFNDGTTTVEPMWVQEAYKQYYLIDTLADGTEWKEQTGTDKYGQAIYKYRTSCLRTPKNTYVYGGSHCFMRACQHVTSKGGAPKDGPHGKYLGQYPYTIQPGDSVSPAGLAAKIQFPLNLTNPNLKDYYDSRSYMYGIQSVAPDANQQLHFWIPDGYGGVTAEQDKYLSIWKACMTEIRAGLGTMEGGVGGHTPIEPNEEVKYFLYCKIDENIHKVIADTVMEGGVSKYTYQAPLEVPPVAKEYFKNADYTTITPSFVGDTTQYEVLSDTTYTITDKVYYVTNATADIWQTFTAPFDVAKISVVETFSENELKKFGTNAPNQRTAILQEQARHNADYAAFFAVAMAMGTYGDFDDINTSYLKWAKKVDEDSLGLSWNKGPLRSKQALVPYVVDANTNKGNWRDANFYLNHNKGNWKLHQVINEDGFEVDSFAVQWEALTPNDTTDGILLHKGETYSLMFPYCPSCDPSLADRDYWDYWSGKYLIFEGPNRPQVINGKDFLRDSLLSVIPSDPTLVADTVKVTGNSTFAFMDVEGPNVYVYNSQEPALNTETFMALYEGDPKQTILPTTAFLYGQLPTRNGMPARSVNLTGKINYDNSNDSGDGTTTGGHIPTVGGGNDLFITSTVTGINVAVAQPQQVRVLSSTGAVIFSGMVQTAVDVLLPTSGVYVITGENEVHKILH